MTSSIELPPAADMHVCSGQLKWLTSGTFATRRFDETCRAYITTRWNLRCLCDGTKLRRDPTNIEPNLTPPVTTTDAALAYKTDLEQLEPNVKFLMTLYLSPELTVEEVKKAKQASIVGNHCLCFLLTSGVKSYPK